MLSRKKSSFKLKFHYVVGIETELWVLLYFRPYQFEVHVECGTLNKKSEEKVVCFKRIDPQMVIYFLVHFISITFKPYNNFSLLHTR